MLLTASMLNKMSSGLVVGTLCALGFACVDLAQDGASDEVLGTTESPLLTPSFRSVASATSVATGVSGNGLVVFGSYWNATAGEHAFRWTGSGGFEDLGKLDGGTQIKANGASRTGSVIVGRGVPAGSSWGKAFTWTAATGAVNMNAPGYDSEATATSNDGSVIVGNQYPRGFRWTAASGFVTLPDWTFARDVSGNGNVITGTTSQSGAANTQRAYRWTSAGGVVALGAKGTCSTNSNPPYDKVTESSGNAISSDGAVVVGKTTINGSSPSGTRSGCPERAFRWTAAGGMQDLGVIGGAQSSSATGVSSDGSVVAGMYWGPANPRAFVWTASGGMEDLRQVLLNLGVTSVTNWNLTEVTDVSQDGTVIVGKGLNKNTNRFEAFRAVIGAYAGSSTCTPTTCAAQGADCGTISDGCGGTLTCGTCTAPSTCGGDGVPNVCSAVSTCVPTTCAAEGATCGSIDDGCGGTLTCGGACSGPTCTPRGDACETSSECCDGRSCRERDGDMVCD